MSWRSHVQVGRTTVGRPTSPRAREARPRRPDPPPVSPAAAQPLSPLGSLARSRLLVLALIVRVRIDRIVRLRLVVVVLLAGIDHLRPAVIRIVLRLIGRARIAHLRPAVIRIGRAPIGRIHRLEALAIGLIGRRRIGRALIAQVVIGRVLLGTAAHEAALTGHVHRVRVAKHHWSRVSSVARAAPKPVIPSCPMTFCQLT